MFKRMEDQPTKSSVIDKRLFVELVHDLHNDERRQESYEELIRLLKDGRLVGLLEQQCVLGAMESNDSEFVNLLVNLPQITANKYQVLNDELFRPANYFKRLCSIVYATLSTVQ